MRTRSVDSLRREMTVNGQAQVGQERRTGAAGSQAAVRLAVIDSDTGFLQVLGKRLEGMGYYTGLCLRITAAAPDGSALPLADGGFTAWTATLAADKKERFLASGIGSELVCRLYRTPS